jgi:soluble P-type ATPase
VLITVDVSAAEIMLARSLGCDAVIAYHPIGISALRFSKVFSRHVDFMVQMGVPKREAWLAVQELKIKFDLRAHANIYTDVVDTAKMLKMPLVNIHQPCDEYMQTEILNKLNSGRTRYVSDMFRSVEEIPEFRNASARIKLVHGNVRSKTVLDSSSIISSIRFLLNLKQYLLASIYIHVNKMFSKTRVRLQDRQLCEKNLRTKISRHFSPTFRGYIDDTDINVSSPQPLI